MNKLRELEKQAKAVAGTTTKAKENESSKIIPQNTISISTLLTNMVDSIPVDVDLIEVLTREIKDPLRKYEEHNEVEKKMEINPLKIPDTLYIVAMVYKLMQISNDKGWGMSRENETIYIFNGKYWELCSKDELYRFFKMISRKMRFYSPAKAETHDFKEKFYKQFIASADFYKPVKKERVILLNCQNGTLEVEKSEIKLREHNPADFIKYVLPFDYEPKAKAPIYQRYLNDVLSEENQKVLQEFCGYIFINSLKIEKCLVCYGSGANGKSVFFETILSLLGDVNVSTKSLGDLTNQAQGSYNRATIKDKLINYGSEINGKSIDVDIFKRLVSGEPVQARLPYGQPFDLANHTKFIFNANELPRIDEHNEAVFRRFLIIPFDRTIPQDKRDTQLHTKIELELSGVLNWVLIGLNRLLLQSGIFSKSLSVDDMLMEYKKESDSVALWVEENEYLQTDSEEYFVLTRGLYSDYREDTIANGKHPVNKDKFSKRFKNLGFISQKNREGRGYLVKKKSFLSGV